MKTDTQEKTAVKLVTKTVTVESKTVALPIDNIDTDQIIPARFLKTTSMEGLGDNFFFHLGHPPHGPPPPFRNPPWRKACAKIFFLDGPSPAAAPPTRDSP